MSAAGRLLTAGIAAASLAVPVTGQGSLPAMSAGRVTSNQTCRYFQNSAGSAGLLVRPGLIAAAAAWRTWWVKDCESDFATIRSSLEAALAAAPARDGRGYRVDLNITEVSGGGEAAPRAPESGDFGIATNDMTVSFDVSVRDARGARVFGTLLTKRLRTGSDIRADGFRTTSRESGQAAYGRMQNEIALAAARAVSFHFAPPLVTALDGPRIRISYGTPYLKLGDLLLATPTGGVETVRYRVVATGQGYATAEIEGDGDDRRVRPGTVLSFAESEDPMQNGRRFRKTELP